MSGLDWIGLAGISLTTLTSRSPDGDKNDAYVKHIEKVKFYPNADNSIQLLLVVILVTNITSAI